MPAQQSWLGGKGELSWLDKALNLFALPSRGGRDFNGAAPTTIALAADRQCPALPRTSHKPEQADPALPPCFRSRPSGAPRQRRHAIPKAAPAAAARPQRRLSAPPHLTRPDRLPGLIHRAADRARLQTYAPRWPR